jgi:hypothetical protein
VSASRNHRLRPYSWQRRFIVPDEKRVAEGLFDLLVLKSQILDSNLTLGDRRTKWRALNSHQMIYLGSATKVGGRLGAKLGLRKAVAKVQAKWSPGLETRRRVHAFGNCLTGRISSGGKSPGGFDRNSAFMVRWRVRPTGRKRTLLSNAALAGICAAPIKETLERWRGGG